MLYETSFSASHTHERNAAKQSLPLDTMLTRDQPWLRVIHRRLHCHCCPTFFCLLQPRQQLCHNNRYNIGTAQQLSQTINGCQAESRGITLV